MKTYLVRVRKHSQKSKTTVEGVYIKDEQIVVVRRKKKESHSNKDS